MADPHEKPREKRPGELGATFSLTGMPEALANMRRDMANLLRHFAADEPPEIAARLRHVADVFETGQAEDLGPEDHV